MVETPLSPRERTVGLAWLYIAAIAIAVRCFYLFEIRHLGFFNGLLSDAAVYYKRATQIAHGDWAGPADFVHAPSYAYLLGLFQIVGLTDLWTPRLFQIALGTVSCLLLGRIGTNLFERRVGLLAGILYALCPAAIFFDCEIQKTSLAAFLIILLLAQMTGARKLSGWRAAGCGLTTGLLILTQQSTLIFVPLLVAWILVRNREDRGSWKRSLRTSIAFLFAVTVALLPWTIRNRSVTGQFTLTTPNFGQNFFMGNSQDASGTYLSQFRSRSTGEHEQEEWTSVAAKALGHAPSLSEVSDYYLHLAMDFIRGHPAAWFRLTLKKILMTWNAYETGDTEDYYLYVEHSVLLAGLDKIFNFGVLGPFAVAGAALTWDLRRRLWPLYVWCGLATIATAAFVVFARYRVPLIPVVITFASAAIIGIESLIRSGNVRRLIAPTLLAGCAAMIMNWPVFLPRRTQPYSYINHASALAQQSRFDEALVELDKAMRLNPTDLSALITRGSTLIDMNRIEDALAAYHRAEAISPEDQEVLVGLVAASLAAERFDEAADYSRRALAHDPDDVRAKTGLATALARSGQTRAAIDLFNEVIKARPNHVDAYVNLGATYLMEGKVKNAIDCWETVLRLSPDNANALQNLASMEINRGHYQRARQLLEHLLTVAPSRAGAKEAYEMALQAEQASAKSKAP